MATTSRRTPEAGAFAWGGSTSLFPLPVYFPTAFEFMTLISGDINQKFSMTVDTIGFTFGWALVAKLRTTKAEDAGSQKQT